MITRRCTQRLFLLRPSPIVNQILLYCLAIAAERYNIQVHAFCFMSNHWHAVITDIHGNRPEFCRWLHEFSSKCINATLGRWENLWASEQTSIVQLVDREAQLDKTGYALCNPVQAALVRRGDLWPGARMGPKDIGSHIVIERPKGFFREDGPLPRTTTLTISKLPALAHLSDDDYAAQLDEMIERREAEICAKILGEGRDFVGARAVRKQSPFDSPSSRTRRRGLSPRVASPSKWARIEALSRISSFVQAYRQAWRAYSNGERPDIAFPHGTYWLRVYAGVLCAAPG